MVSFAQHCCYAAHQPTPAASLQVHHSASQHVHYDVDFIEWKDLQSPDRKGHEAESGFVGMSEHCRRRYSEHPQYQTCVYIPAT